MCFFELKDIKLLFGEIFSVFKIINMANLFSKKQFLYFNASNPPFFLLFDTQLKKFW